MMTEQSTTAERTHEQVSNGDNDCCCCLKARFQPWHGPRCPHGLGGKRCRGEMAALPPSAPPALNVLRSLRDELRGMYIVHPDGSHGEDYLNRGLLNALRRVTKRIGDVDFTTRCEPDGVPMKDGNIWCKAHIAPMGLKWSCDFAERAWEWHDADRARLQEHDR